MKKAQGVRKAQGIRVYIRLPEAFRAKLAELAKRNGRSFNGEVFYGLRIYVAGAR